MPMNSLYNTKLFNEIFETQEDFENESIFTNYEFLENATAQERSDVYHKIFWLLSAKYGNSPIANMSENQFKMKMGMIMYQHAPVWLKRLDIQKELRALTIDSAGDSTQLSKSALNPETAPSSDDLDYVNSQNKTVYKKSKLSNAENLFLLQKDVTSDFLDKFKPLFKVILIPAEYIYETEEESE